jgi:hypothetical protein
MVWKEISLTWSNTVSLLSCHCEIQLSLDLTGGTGLTCGKTALRRDTIKWTACILSLSSRNWTGQNARSPWQYLILWPVECESGVSLSLPRRSVNSYPLTPDSHMSNNRVRRLKGCHRHLPKANFSDYVNEGCEPEPVARIWQGAAAY